MNELVLILNFITNAAFLGIGVWLGLRLQKERVKQEIKHVFRSLPSLKKNLTKAEEGGIVKALTPEQIKQQGKLDFEKENYK